MSRKSVLWGLVVAGVMALSAAGIATAQDNAAPGGAAGGGNAGGGNNWVAQQQQRVKDGLAVTEDEWKVLQPKIDKISTLNRDLRAGLFGGGRGGRGGRGGATANATPASDVEQKLQALRTALENKDTKAEEITQKVKDLRAAREKVKADLVKAQAELRELLTPRQEAFLLTMGTLD